MKYKYKCANCGKYLEFRSSFCSIKCYGEVGKMMDWNKKKIDSYLIKNSVIA